MWFDPTTVEAVSELFPEWTALLFALLSHLGSVWFVAPVIVLAYWFGDRERFAPWLAIVMGGYAVMVGLKGLFATPRPDVAPPLSPAALPIGLEQFYAPAVEVATTSFPSGHAIAGTVIWTMLALESPVGTRRQRALVAVVMITLVSLSRVVLGVHFPIDVIVGVAVALGYLAVALAVRSRVGTHNPHGAASALFVLAGTIALLALVTGNRLDGAALLGGSVGALVVWQYAPPPRTPWPVTAGVLVRAAAGVGALALAALVLVVLESLLVWFAVGVAGGVTVVGLPGLVTDESSPRSQVGAIEQ
ncbi:PA-phosphatase-like phosphoesterase [Natrialba hulunbeirensis JCM 10989]|uniref:PA-phosphatase-like phosphoesterase n=1 Tax=Natrialba hulunbeirensis JCM 10989 TaxID=1227493 RepID=M0A281_9EURY|nr:phosphatase PAP2 family protein [Natrialba hulunbeirensis]ELY92724.1 PA-phosphatase-like phosphoesterase [Natrialba hulunbeirensis JCM 10989]